MAREPSVPGVRSGRGAITKRDGTWPLPEELQRERAQSGAMPVVSVPAVSVPASGPVEALRAPSMLESSAAPAFPKPPRPARPPGLTPGLSKLWNEVLERHDTLTNVDHYAALGLRYEAGSADVQQAFSALIARFHPDKLPGELELMRPYAVRIVARLNVARMMLATRHDRVVYLRELGRPIPPASSHPPPPGAAVARVRPERRPVPNPSALPRPAREVPLRVNRAEPPVRAKRESKPPSASERLLRALRRERPPSE
jgi:hypothetical protein